MLREIQENELQMRMLCLVDLKGNVLQQGLNQRKIGARLGRVENAKDSRFGKNTHTHKHIKIEIFCCVYIFSLYQILSIIVEDIGAHLCV